MCALMKSQPCINPRHINLTADVPISSIFPPKSSSNDVTPGEVGKSMMRLQSAGIGDASRSVSRFRWRWRGKNSISIIRAMMMVAIRKAAPSQNPATNYLGKWYSWQLPLAFFVFDQRSPPTPVQSLLATTFLPNLSWEIIPTPCCMLHVADCKHPISY
jgi:hypothetical protein